MVSVDLTFIYQIIGYFILLYLMNTLLYRPIVAVMKDRDKKTTETEGGAKETHAEIESGLEKYQESLKEAASAGQLDRAKTKLEATAKEKEITEAARAEALAELDKIRLEIESEKKSAMDALSKDAQTLSKTLASKILGRAVPAFLITFLLTTDAFASGGGNSLTEPLFLWKLGMFVAILIGGYYGWNKIISPILGGKIDAIKEALNAATVAKEEAEAKLKEYKATIGGLDAKVKEIQDTIREEAELEKEKIISEAKASAEKIKEQAKLTTSQEIKKAKIELKNAASVLAVELAEKTLIKEVKDSDQAKLTTDYIEKIKLA